MSRPKMDMKMRLENLRRRRDSNYMSKKADPKYVEYSDVVNSSQLAESESDVRGSYLQHGPPQQHQEGSEKKDDRFIGGLVGSTKKAFWNGFEKKAISIKAVKGAMRKRYMQSNKSPEAIEKALDGKRTVKETFKNRRDGIRFATNQGNFKDLTSKGREILKSKVKDFQKHVPKSKSLGLLRSK